ncbi:MAG: response regulator with CheY-like receiver domain and winged-helix DNA-binding domain [Verrucomicrobiales bacterium]|nr:response regulator with CheY-like receiver domain and winged-helix DNA-binding domain [Verrucomicrobiales bacterium]
MFSSGETILLGESYEFDEFFFIRTLKQAHIACSVRVLETGLEVLHYLQGRGKFADREEHPLPSVIFLEMYLPTISGLEILQWAQTQDYLRSIPIVTFVDEIDSAACERAKSLGALGCIAKPFTIEHIEWLKDQVQHA